MAKDAKQLATDGGEEVIMFCWDSMLYYIMMFRKFSLYPFQIWNLFCFSIQKPHTYGWIRDDRDVPE